MIPTRKFKLGERVWLYAMRATVIELGRSYTREIKVEVDGWREHQWVQAAWIRPMGAVDQLGELVA